MFSSGEPPNRRSQPQRQQEQQFSASKTSPTTSLTVHSLSSASGSQTSVVKSATTGGEGYQISNTVVRRSTPVLFSTGRGLHLRVAKPPSSTEHQQLMASVGGRSRQRQLSASAYEIRFCDLERWSTNRANTVSLEDTFTVSHPSRHSLASQHSQLSADSGGSKNSHLGCGGNSLFNVHCKRSTSVVRFRNSETKGFCRFDDN